MGLACLPLGCEAGPDDVAPGSAAGGARGKGDQVLYGSCEAACGGQSIDGNCWCDAACEDYGDCCSDLAAECAACGDGLVDTSEQCDVAIAAGEPGACPVACDDGDACTDDAVRGDGCDARCVFTLAEDCDPIGLIGDPHEVCTIAGRSSPPTLAVGEAGYAIGCTTSQGLYESDGWVELYNWDDQPTGTVNTRSVNGYYYTDLQLGAVAGAYHLIYQYLCADDGSFGEGTGWGCIEAQRFDQAGASVGAAIVFGQPGNNAHPVAAAAGDRLTAAWVSYDDIFIRGLFDVEAEVPMTRVWEDPDDADVRDGARTRIVWNGETFGIFATLRRQMVFGEVAEDGTVVTPFTTLGRNYYAHEFGGQSEALFVGDAYYLLSPLRSAMWSGTMDRIALQRVEHSGEVSAEAVLDEPLARFPTMLHRDARFYVLVGDGDALRAVAYDADVQLDLDRSATMHPDPGFLVGAAALAPDGDALVAFTDGSWSTYSPNDVYVQRLRFRK